MIVDKKNLFFGGIIISMLVGEMLFSAIVSFYVIRILQFFLVFNFLWKQKFSILKNSIEFYLYPILSFVLLSIFYFQINIIASEFYTILWWFLFLSVINYEVKTIRDLNYFLKITSTFVFILTGIAAILGIVKIILVDNGFYLPQFEVYTSSGIKSVIGGTSLNADYNVFSIGLYCGLFSGLNLYRELKTEKVKFLYSLVFILIIICSMLSGSRRGFIIGIILIPYLILFSLYSNKNKETSSNLSLSRKKDTPWIIYMITLLLFITFYKIDLNKIIESSQDLSNLFDRIYSIETMASEDDSRSARWDFALNYYGTLPKFNQIFGDGFEYVNLFTNHFNVELFDYPHNVWISSLLYGGILGLFTTVILTIFVLIFYFKNRHTYKEFFFWYIFFLLLNSSSSNSIFSSRLFMVLILIPCLNINKLTINKNK